MHVNVYKGKPRGPHVLTVMTGPDAGKTGGEMQHQKNVPSTGKSSNSSSSSSVAADFCAVWACSGFSACVFSAAMVVSFVSLL